MYDKELQQFGLTEKEARVYIASLELGADAVQHIAKKAGINRATTYVQIESLKKKGLMSEFEKGKKTLYLAESPDRLAGLLRVFEKELAFKKDELARVLPALVSLAVAGKERPKVRFYEGLDGVRAVWEDFLKTKSKAIEAFMNLDKLFGAFKEHVEEYSEKRIKKGIQSDMIYNRAAGPLPEATDQKRLRTAKYVSAERFPITADVTMYDNKIAFLTYGARPIGVIIENAEITDTMRGAFRVLWKTL